MGLPRVCALAVVCVGIVGCGGSSGGGNGSGGEGGGSTAITVTFQGPAPTAVAAMIGSGAFAPQSLASGTLLLSIPSGTSDFAVAFVCPPVAITAGGSQLGQTAQESIFEASTSDGTSFTEACPPAPQSFQTGALTGSVDASAIPGAAYVSINAQSGSSSASTNSTNLAAHFSLSAPAGTNRVEVLAFRSALGGVESTALLAARNFNNQTVPGALNEGNPVVLSAADETTAAPIAYNNVPSGFPPASTAVLYEMAGGGAFLIADAAADTYPMLPAAAAQPGDRYAFQASARNLQGNSQQTVSSSVYGSQGGPIAFTFPPPWSYAGPNPAALPTFDFTYTGFAGKPGVAEGAAAGWWTGSYSNGTLAESVVSVSATASRASATPTLAIPDLSHLPGFLPNPPSGAQAAWSAIVTVDGWSVVQNGSSAAAYASVQNAGVYTVP